jgi:hypothetical protein
MLAKEKREAIRGVTERCVQGSEQPIMAVGLAYDLLAILDALDEAERRLRVAEAALKDRAMGSPVPQCLVARLGEGTLECDATRPCASCRLMPVRRSA